MQHPFGSTIAIRAEIRAAMFSAVFALALTACGSSQKASDPTTTESRDSETTSTVPVGSSSTAPSTSTSTTVGATTTTAAGPIDPLALNGSGIGSQTFGDPADEVVAALEAELGAPFDDRLEQAFSSSYGVCPGNQVRVVEWGGFVVLFSDGATPYAPGGTFTFFDWQLRNLGASTPPLSTAEGIALSDPVSDVRAAYPAVQVEDDEILGPTFRVGSPPDELRGGLSGTDESATVVSLGAGSACGE